VVLKQYDSHKVKFRKYTVGLVQTVR